MHIRLVARGLLLASFFAGHLAANAHAAPPFANHKSPTRLERRVPSKYSTAYQGLAYGTRYWRTFDYKKAATMLGERDLRYIHDRLLGQVQDRVSYRKDQRFMLRYDAVREHYVDVFYGGNPEATRKPAKKVPVLAAKRRRK